MTSSGPQSQKVRTRFAPSPTGYLHVGGARTALYCYLYAKQQGGEFILRIEDTDAERSNEEALRGVIDDLVWLNLLWDEGPDAKTLKDIGPYGPYRQSERLPIYKEVADKIISEGRAYYCFLADEELEKQRAEQMAAGQQPHVISPYADWTLAQAKEKIAAGGKPVVRFKTKNLKKDYAFKDLVRGDVKFPSDMVGDFVLLRSDGMPVYNFCCVVDDYMMKMTHVLRAEEHLPNTLRQMMIYEAMGWKMPEFGHLSLVLDEDRQKLSKRKGAVSCHQYHLDGYLPGAIKNYVALLGWSHPEENKEILSMDDMIRGFSLDRLHPSGAVFDRVKLKWMNSMHLRALSDADLWAAVEPFLKKEGLAVEGTTEWKHKTIHFFKTSMEVLTDAVPLYALLDDSRFGLSPEAGEVLAQPTAKLTLQTWKELLQAHPREDFTEAEFLKIQDEVKAKAGVKGKNLFMPIRVAVIGMPHGRELAHLVPLMTKKSLVARAEKVLAGL